VSEPEPEPRPEPEPAEVSATAADGADSTDGDPETDGTPEATAAESGAETGADAEAGTEAAAAPDALNALTGEAAAAGPGTDGYGTEHGPGTGFAPSPESGFEPSYAAPHEPAPFHDAPSEHPSASYVLRVNGADRPVTDAWIGESLLYVLRERLGLAGAKDGCSQGECGACAVQVDGRLVASCLVPAATTAGSEVRTVEGLATDGEPSDVQRALANCGAVQCGFCIPGMAMTVHDLLEGNHAPTELETRQALCGNLCRCSGYRGVLEAVRDVVAEREASAEAAATGHTPDEARIPHQAPPGAGSAQHTLHHPHDGGMA
jgi:aerobic-type carbon monoxide dehydrogenase small subunit (CoxS/CutS family)